MDFLADGLKIQKNAKGKLLLCALIFVPPLLIGMSHPHIFLQALDYAGGYGCALLLGLLPVLTVAQLRKKHPDYTPQVGGGNALLLILALFVLLELAVEILF